MQTSLDSVGHLYSSNFDLKIQVEKRNKKRHTQTDENSVSYSTVRKVTNFNATVTCRLPAGTARLTAKR
jgi:hypothetical protein